MDMLLVDRLRQDYPEVRFRRGRKFLFRPPKTIVLGPEEEYDELLMLHEMGHFLMHHTDYATLPERVKMEREAWEKARELCEAYDVEYVSEVAESELDSYRDWLDQKSRCPCCGLTRYQTPDGVFHCPRCENFMVKK